MPAVQDEADIHRDQVAGGQRRVVGDPVHDHLVGRGADAAGEAPVAEERGNGTLLPDQALRQSIEVEGADPRRDRGLELVDHIRQRLAGDEHLLDLLRRLFLDHDFSPDLPPLTALKRRS